MDMQLIFGVLSAFLGFAGYTYYIYEIFKGHVRPHIFSFIVWGVTVTTVFVAQVYGGAGAGAWAMGVTACLIWGVVIGAFFRIHEGDQYITKADWLFLLGALSGIPLWFIFDGPLISVIVLTLVDGLGYIPTFRKVISMPQEEQTALFVTQGLKHAFSIFAMAHYSFVTTLYPATILLLHFVMVWHIYRCRQRLGLS